MEKHAVYVTIAVTIFVILLSSHRKCTLLWK